MNCYFYFVLYLDLRSSECDVVSMLCVALSMCLFVLCVACLTVFVNCLVSPILLLNVMELFSVCGGALLDRPCMVFQRVCVLCL